MNEEDIKQIIGARIIDVIDSVDSHDLSIILDNNKALEFFYCTDGVGLYVKDSDD